MADAYTAAVDSAGDVSSYVTSLDEIQWGGFLVAISLAIHAFGMLWTLRTSEALKMRFQRTPTFAGGLSILILTSWMITLVHILEVMTWAAFFQWKHCFANYSQAAYYAFTEYTTVGGDLNLPQKWRLLAGMIATAGLLGFAWSTGVLLTLAEDFQREQLQRYRKRHQEQHPSS